MADTYNGFKNWETWVTSMNYGDVLYNLAKAYVELDMKPELFRAETEALIRQDTYSGIKFPSDYNLVQEFVLASLRSIDYDHLADSAWEQALKDTAK